MNHKYAYVYKRYFGLYRLGAVNVFGAIVYEAPDEWLSKYVIRRSDSRGFSWIKRLSEWIRDR
jgi:hypothetical protein